MKVNTMHAKIVADHSEVYKTLFQYSNIKDGDSILLITLGHPVYYLKLKKEYPNSLILNIEDVNFRFLWTNYLLNVELVNTEDIESLTKFFKERKMKFDHIIANPPYEFGNAITTTVLNNVDFDDYVNLMPVSKYNGKLYQHIIPNSLKQVKWTGDASTNPQIALLRKTKDTSITKADFNTWCYDPKFAKFYLENQKRERSWIKHLINVGQGQTEEECREYLRNSGISYDTDFLFTLRTMQDGIHTTPNCWDYKWNVERSIKIDELHIYYDTTFKSWHSLVGFIFFKTKVEKDNFTKFWYSGGKKGLMNKLIKGTGSQGGSPINIIPRVDWSKEWTDKEILKDYGYTDEEIKELLK